MPLVSVIVPNYNHSKFLKQRIDSILNQTYRDFELIILDDYSTDDSKKIIERYRGHNHVSHIVFNEKNSGSPFIQWKKGIDLAMGDLIWIAESDDYAENSFLDEIFKRFNSDGEIGVVYCDSNVIENEKKLLDFYKIHRNSVFNTNYWNHDYINLGRHEINNYLLFECTINNTSSMVFKKKLINEELFDNLKLFKYSGDWYFFMTLLINCKIAYVNKSFNYKRKEGDNFKEGVRTKLNHFRERSLVRFLITKCILLDDYILQKVIAKLGLEMKTIIVDLINTNGNLYLFYEVCNQLRSANKALYNEILKHDPLLSLVYYELRQQYKPMNYMN